MANTVSSEVTFCVALGGNAQTAESQMESVLLCCVTMSSSGTIPKVPAVPGLAIRSVAHGVWLGRGRRGR